MQAGIACICLTWLAQLVSLALCLLQLNMVGTILNQQLNQDQQSQQNILGQDQQNQQQLLNQKQQQGRHLLANKRRNLMSFLNDQVRPAHLLL